MTELVQRLRDGDPTVINELVELHLPILDRTVRGFFHKYRDLDDLRAQGSLILIEQIIKASYLLRDDNLSAFIASRLKRRLQNYIRDTVGFERKKIVLFNDVEAYTEPEPVSTRLEFGETLKELTRDTREREILLLLMEGYTQKEIAYRVGTGEKNVSRIHQALIQRLHKWRKPTS